MKIAILHPSSVDSLAPFRDLDPPRAPDHYLPGHDYVSFQIRKASAVRQVVEIARMGFDAAINLCDGAWDEDRPGIEVVQALERVGMAFTGAASSFYDPSREAMKMACHSVGVKFPAYVHARHVADANEALRLRFPLIVKHPHSYSSVGLTRQSRVTNSHELFRETERIIDAYGAALIEEFMPLARSLARGFGTNRDSRDDLVQVACVGLVKAFDRFDPERGLRFSSFAVPTILGELRRHLRDRTWRLHVPRELQELSVALGPVAESLSGELGRPPTVDELAGRLRVTPAAIWQARQAAHTQADHSLDEPAHADARESLANTLGGEDRELARTERVIVLESWLAALPELQREILRLRFREDLTQREVGQRLGISQTQVSRLIRMSLAHLQAMAAQDEERSVLVA